MRGTGNLVVYHSHGLWLSIYLDTVGQNAGRFQYNCSMYYRYIFGRNDSQTYLALIQIKVTSELVARLARVKSIRVYSICGFDKVLYISWVKVQRDLRSWHLLQFLQFLLQKL